ncbi:MAG: fibronectin type 3 domain-containing protein [Paraglaciecola psychrophila]|jgi:fibronectin type 3 domain-containing protein
MITAKKLSPEVYVMNFNNVENLLKTTLTALCFTLLTACGGGGGGGGGVGYQDDDLPPVANASVLALGNSLSTTKKSFAARSNTEIVITGKDSLSDYAPIQEYVWQQTGSGPSVELIERTNSAVLFTAPNVGVDTELNFLLTITDANGKTDTDELAITIIAVDDAGRFLSDPRSPDRQLSLVAALRGGETTGSSSHSFTLEVITTAHWRNRLGEMDQLVVKTETISDSFASNFSPAINYDPLAEPANPILVIELYPLDLDDINHNFETVDRDRRLEVYEAGSAYLEIQITIVDSPSIDFELIALNISGDSINSTDIVALANETFSGASAALPSAVTKSLTRTKINGKRLTGPVNASTADNGALLQTWNSELSATLLTNNVLAALGLESNISANNYYALIDPSGQFSNLSNWLYYAGFENANGDAVSDDAISHAVYLNNYDLGFARDMWLRKDNNGNVYAYVTNYPTIEAALESRGEFAVVAMEYSENPDPAGENAKIVKFYAFVPDERTGNYVRSTSMNFDGGGEKFLPGVCTACHQSYPGLRQYTDVSEADLDATFMPWDLDSFLYAHASDPKFIETTLDPTKFDAQTLNANSREALEEQLRQLNLGTLATYVDNPGRHAAAIQLIHGWYGDEDLDLPVDKLPTNNYNGDYTQPGWAAQDQLYHDVYARNCRICHTQINDQDLNFDTYDKFIDRGRLIDYVFELGLMPMARLSLDRLWVPYDGGESGANILRSHLQSLGNTVPTAPGAPVPRFTFNTVTPTIDGPVIMDASTSAYAKSYSWSLVGPQASTATLNNLSGVSSTFNPDIAGGDYEVSLTITNESGIQRTLVKTLSVIDRSPIASCLSVDGANMSNSGLLAGIPLISRIAASDDGDGGVTVEAMIDGALGAVSIDAGSLAFSYQLFNPFDRGVDLIGYQLADADGSLSITGNDCLNSPADGFGYITIDSSSAGLLPTNVTAAADSINNSFEINVSWDPPTEVTADSYTLWRDGSEVLLNSQQQNNRSYTDSPLVYDTTYSYTVRALIDGFESADSFAAVTSTASLVPTALVGTSVNSTQINLRWVAPAGNATSYNIYRDAGTGSVLLQGNISAQSYTDNNVAGSTLYEYTVTGLDSSGQESVASNIASNAPKPNPPASLSATSISTSQINLSWPAVAGASSYKIYRKLSTEPGFPGTPLATPGNTSYSDITVGAGFTYDYRVGVTVGFEDSITFTTASETAFPEALTLDSAAVNGTSTSEINLSWTSAGGNVSGYIVYRGATAIATGSTSTTYTDSAAAAGTLHSYRVTAMAGGYESAPSNILNEATYPVNPAPAAAVVAAGTDTDGSGKVTVTWSEVTGDSVTYAIAATGTLVTNGSGATAGGVTSFSDASASVSRTMTGLSSYSDYTVTVTATANGLSASTNTSVRTGVSYANDITTGPSATKNCASCHDDDVAVPGSLRERYTKGCVTSNNLPSCPTGTDAGSMNGLLFTDAELIMVNLWNLAQYD